MRLFLNSMVCAGLASLSAGALAAPGLTAMAEFAEPDAVAAAAPAASLALLPTLAVELGDASGLGAGTDEAALEQARGGAADVSNEARLNGYVTGNSATYVNTGANSIDGGAFANASGIPIVIQNSGANVLIQNATIINLQMR
ncbi:hypothetical protein [Janthinobacterium sp. J1-1]|uniref:hypothetical protein n=1 Tax=Janthinobacterium sp. J1-1 TaxID=3065910 RepID=UPI002810DFFD|nr:hypothetical protein [Janthinobacterium sp. J1-1]